jgi:RimJ/RimL family protein N-acetyltransferase
MVITIEPATSADIPGLMTVERGEGFERVVGRWSAEQHAAEMALAGSHYLVARSAEGTVEGFVLLQGLDDPQNCATLRRIAVARPGERLGPRLLAAALAHAFQCGAHRVQLRVYPENARARQAYERIGFQTEGLMRDCSRQADGSYRSMILMSILRPERELLRK